MSQIKIGKLTALMLLAVLTPASVIAQGNGPLSQQDPVVRRPVAAPAMDPRKVGLDQKRGEQVPLDIPFTDEAGNPVKIGDFFTGKPVILNLIFYKCPGVCMAELDGMTKLFRDQEMSLSAGKDFEVVTVSINPKETPQMAADKKREYLELLGNRANPSGWHFLVGELDSIQRLAQVVGFRYAYDSKTDQFAHPAGIMILTPAGKISHYFFGINYRPRDVRFSLIEASENKIGSLADKIVLNCMYQYDPKTGRYGLAIVRALQVGGILTVLTLVTSILVMNRVYNRQMDKWEKRAAEARSTPTSGGATV